jgi:GNAT superfamily N-acetyltransferase
MPIDTPSSPGSEGQPLPGPELVIRPIRDDERAELERVVSERWGSPRMVSRGTVHRIADLACLIATDQRGRWAGLAAYRAADGACELVMLEAFERGHGTGAALLDAVIAAAREAGLHRLWLVTTNDNTDALRFYQRRGLRLAHLRPEAVTQARELLKPEIPLLGEHGIPIRDEIELDLELDSQPPAAGSNRAAR